MYMTYFITITSQGQISIPAPIRRRFALDKIKKATLEVKNNKIIIEPIKDLSELKGVFKTNKKVTFRSARDAFEKALSKSKA